MVTKTEQELAEMKELIQKGELPPDAIKQYYADERRNVFGFDHKTDRNGKPVEQGVGSAGNQSRNSIEAFKKYHAHEPDFEKQLSRMERELAETNARRRAATQEFDR
jgi:hypothetical protein